MNDNIKQLQVAVASAEERVANWTQVLKERVADLEEARKPTFKPFTVAITVQTLEQARTLGAIGGANGSTARFIAEHGSEIFGDTSFHTASRAIADLLAPFFQKFVLTPNGDWAYQA